MSTASFRPVPGHYSPVIGIHHRRIPPNRVASPGEPWHFPAPNEHVTAVVIDSLARSDRWQGLREDEPLAPSMRMRSQLGLDFPRVAALSAAMRDALPHADPLTITECIATAYDGDATVKCLATRLARVAGWCPE